MPEGSPTLYIWLGGEPDLVAYDVDIIDVPGERDLDLIAQAIKSGRFGLILPVRISYAEHSMPRSGQWKSIDTSRLLRDYDIRHRRRYEVFLDPAAELEPSES